MQNKGAEKPQENIRSVRFGWLQEKRRNGTVAPVINYGSMNILFAFPFSHWHGVDARLSFLPNFRLENIPTGTNAPLFHELPCVMQGLALVEL